MRLSRLFINVDHVATVRQARLVREPDPVEAALLAELAGADGITVHLREDRRHIQDRDVRLLREILKSKLNLEMAAVPPLLEIALKLKPDQATFVPERREELTTEGGLKLEGEREDLAQAIDTLKEEGILVSLFVDPDLDLIKKAHKLKADAIELNTAAYSEAKTLQNEDEQLEKIQSCARLAEKLEMRVHAGHGLNYRNVQKIASILEVEELNIGHSIIARAVLVGMEKAVREMKDLMEKSSLAAYIGEK